MGLIAFDRLEIAYTALKETYLASSQPVLILTNMDVDASLFKEDYISYKIVAVSGYTTLSEANERFLEGTGNISSVIMINAGGMIDVSEFLTLTDSTRVYVIDCHRPFNLTNIFGTQQISILDDGTLGITKTLQDAYRGLEFEDVDEEESDSSSDEEDEEQESDMEEDGESQMDRNLKKERKKKKREYQARIAEYYSEGTYSGMPSATVLYALASQMGRASQGFLWYTIVALTDIYLNNSINEEDYLSKLGSYRDESGIYARSRDTPNDSLGDGLLGERDTQLTQAEADDFGIEYEEDLRLTLFRHWNLYESMFHTSFVAASLGLWRQKGRQTLTNLLLKMGLPQKESLQYYSEMSIQYKKMLREKLATVGPRYNLPDVLFPSFVKKFGFASKYSASDIVFAIAALLDGGDSWIRGSGSSNYESILNLSHTAQRFSSAPGDRSHSIFDVKYSETGFVGAGMGTLTPSGLVSAHVMPLLDRHGRESQSELDPARNFFLALDAIDQPQLLNHGVLLAIHFQQILVRAGMSLIEKKAIRTLRYFQMVILSNAATSSMDVSDSDFKLFSQSRIYMYRLGRFLMSAFMEFKQKKLPMVLVAWNEDTKDYMVMGIPPYNRTGDLKKNPFGLAFLSAAQKIGLETNQDSFDSFVVHVQKDDLTNFLESLSLTIL